MYVCIVYMYMSQQYLESSKAKANARLRCPGYDSNPCKSRGLACYQGNSAGQAIQSGSTYDESLVYIILLAGSRIHGYVI